MQVAAAVPIWASIPFVLFLLCIATLPLINREWWDRRYYIVALVVGIAGVALYILYFGSIERLAHTAHDYVSFIALLASLFTVTGGILIRIEGRAHPAINTALLFFGALLANVVGTTGASMLLIRPYLHLNQARLKGYLVVFFIFVVSNVGGALTPIGDPPLFLGYLKGVPFFWLVGRVWREWLFAIAAILTVFAVIDFRNHRAVSPIGEAAAKTRLMLRGSYNFLFLAVIIGAVFLNSPHREILMLAAAVGSYLVTPKGLHKSHHFSFAPIVEVAVIFFGIFATMMPALDWLEVNAGSLGLSSPGSYYWATGVLSSFLDNAPTYLSFLSAAMGGTHMDVAGLMSQAPLDIVAISLGAVFFGAATYIGNGPNFMVKSIADRAHVHCPSFLGYIFRYTLPVLIPIFFLVWIIFLR